jgi:heat shock protein HslJ
MSGGKALAIGPSDGKPSGMKGTRIAWAFAFGTLAAMLALGGCKKGKESSTAADEKRELPPSGTVGSESESTKIATLEDTHWALLELNGKPITVKVNDEVPYLELNSKKASAYGFGGCNRFFGSYQASEGSLKFDAMGATRMACPDGMNQEQELFTVLASTTRYEIHGSKLLLFADKTLVARFEARARPE